MKITSISSKKIFNKDLGPGIFSRKLINSISLKKIVEANFKHSGVLRVRAFTLVREGKQRRAWSDSEWVIALQE